MIELLVVVSIIAVLVSVLLPGLGQARATARVAACGARQRQVITAFFTYAGERSDRLPHAVSLSAAAPTGDWSGTISALVGNVAVFQCPEDNLPRLGYVDPQATPPRSYYVNDSKWTYFGNNYRGPWPRYDLGTPSTVAITAGVADVARLSEVPVQVLILGERYNSWFQFAGASFTSYVGHHSYFGVEGTPSTDHYNGAAGNYSYPDGHVRLVRADVYLPWRIDTDYGGDRGDPWKWRR